MTQLPELDQDIATKGPPPLSWSVTGLALLTAALWGGTAVAVRFSVDTLPPVGLAGLRFAIATLFMWFWCRWEGCGLEVREGQWKPILWSGLMLFLQIATFHIGLQWSNATHGSLLINTYTFWVVGFEHFVTRSDRLTFRRILGLILAAVGCGLVVAFDATPSTTTAPAVGDPATLRGDIMLLISALVLGLKTVYTKQVLKVIEPGKLVFWNDGVAVVLFVIYSLLFEQMKVGDFTLPATIGLLYQSVVVAGFCFAVATWLLQWHSASQISVFSFATPLFGLALGVWLRKDAVSPWLLISGLFVAVGIWLVTATESK